MLRLMLDEAIEKEPLSIVLKSWKPVQIARPNPAENPSIHLTVKRSRKDAGVSAAIGPKNSNRLPKILLLKFEVAREFTFHIFCG
jgi:hypothetical protein